MASKNTALFDDLMEGLEAMKAHIEGKITLPSYTLTRPQKETITQQEIKAIREQLNLSQAVFALQLRASLKTYQGWEQGKSKPNPQAAFLIRLAQREPELFQQVALS
ncbi:helix-turn-helix domain-containing protein [Conservatibacter flavescens]|uniref:Transcriptional regulator n=1 Tax=Conservatibacter flavescens TaxID=28161 RepID=A0A2M8S5K8_9PAST|nr:helix-turn-helix domain-containing protein [Conservatibacter flavescens]PJG86439.1 transcriptional regulator [Conservatibacter flavescens]